MSFWAQVGTCTFHLLNWTPLVNWTHSGQQFGHHLPLQEHVSWETHPPDQRLVAYRGPLITHSIQQMFIRYQVCPRDCSRHWGCYNEKKEKPACCSGQVIPATCPSSGFEASVSFCCSVVGTMQRPVASEHDDVCRHRKRWLCSSIFTGGALLHAIDLHLRGWVPIPCLKSALASESPEEAHCVKELCVELCPPMCNPLEGMIHPLLQQHICQVCQVPLKQDFLSLPGKGR